MNRGNILLIDDEEKLRHLLTRIIRLEGYAVFEAESIKTGLKTLERQQVDVIICDVKLPDGNGVDAIEKIRTKYPKTEIVMLTAFGNIAAGVQAIKNGAFDYLTKGDDNDRIIPILDRAIEKINLLNRAKISDPGTDRQYVFENIIGHSPFIQEAIRLARKVAPTEATVLLLGETGTGKEVFAQSIHMAGKRSSNPFVALNVSSFSKELLESELFGHLAGSFTSAAKDKRGLLEEADGGTIFLDEIGEMAFDLQAKLLRVLETSEFIKVGDTKATRIDVRIIAATNRDLQKDSEEGKFREDLFYRLNTFTIKLPALRERKSDIPVLCEFFLGNFSRLSEIRVQTMSKEFLEHMTDHPWKGNIRELKNVMQRAVILASGPELTIADLPLEFLSNFKKEKVLSAFDLASMEKLHIQRVLNHTKNNKMAAARLLNIGLTTLYRKIEEYKL